MMLTITICSDFVPRDNPELSEAILGGDLKTIKKLLDMENKDVVLHTMVNSVNNDQLKIIKYLVSIGVKIPKEASNWIMPLSDRVLKYIKEVRRKENLKVLLDD